MNGKKNNREELKWNKEEEEKLKEIIDKGNFVKMNEYCQYLGKEYVKGGLTTSQIRNIFDTIQRMNDYNESQLQLLRYKLAYIAGRHERKARVIKDHLQPMLDYAIQMTNEKNFKNFKYFLEAIVAYHRYFGGKE